MGAEYYLYTMKNCPWCDKVKELLKEHGIDYMELEYLKDFTRNQFIAMIGSDERPTLPKLFKGKELIGGYEATKLFLEGQGDAQ